MRVSRRLVGLLLLAALAGGCDTTQPQVVDTQMVTMSLAAAGAAIETFDVWDGFEDADGDMQADDVDGDGQPDFFLWCEDIGGFDEPINPTAIPWPYTIRIRILRAGETTPTVLTSNDALTESANLTGYDTTVQLGATFPHLPIVEGGRTFLFDNPRRMSAANREVVVAQAATNPLHQLNPGAYGLGNGLCSTGDPGPAKLDNGALPYTLELQKGDTLLVEVRRGSNPPLPVAPAQEPVITREPSLSVAVQVDGRNVAVNGNTSVGAVGGGPIAFSFTSL